MKSLLIILIAIIAASHSHAAVNIGYVANPTVGGFVSSSTAAISSGGVSVGFFSLDPAAGFWSGLSETPSTAWSAILTAGYTDVRQVGTPGGTFDWSFPLNMGGTVSGISFTTLPQNTRLYVIGFDGGSFNLATPSNSWAGAAEYGVVSAFGHATSSQNFLSPADLGTKAINFGAATALTSSDVLVGTLASATTVAMVPEPSTYALLGLAGLALGGYAARRRRRA
jgi:hypothetical protein